MRFGAYNKVLIEDIGTCYVLRILIGDWLIDWLIDCWTSKEACWKFSRDFLCFSDRAS